MITLIIQTATQEQLIAAREWTADNLHVPRGAVTPAVAVAYVLKHFEMGVLSGWDGFTETLKG